MMSCANRCQACIACAFLERKHVCVDQSGLFASLKRALELIEKDSACQIVAREIGVGNSVSPEMARPNKDFFLV